MSVNMIGTVMMKRFEMFFIINTSDTRVGASYFRLLRPLRAISVKKLGGSGGMLPQEKI